MERRVTAGIALTGLANTLAGFCAVIGPVNFSLSTGIIAANRQLGQTLQIQGTPSFIMGESFVRGFVELDQMRAIVEAVRAENG